MQTAIPKAEISERRGKGFIVFICNKIYNLISKYSESVELLPASSSVTNDTCVEIDREGQFEAYVHNRMSILLMWIQNTSKTGRNISARKQQMMFFLHDLEHHFIDPYVDQKVRDAFRWLRIYIKVYPLASKKDRTQRAYEMVARIYEGLGIAFRF